MTISNTIPAKSLADVAVQAAINAVATNDRSTWRAVCSLSLLMVNRQIEEIDNDRKIDDAKNKSAFRAFLKVYASRGNVVWRGTEHLVTAVMARKGPERIEAVNRYIDGQPKGKASHPCDKPEGAKYAEHIARLRTWAFRLMEDVCTNFQDEVRQIRTLRDSGATPDVQVEYFKNFVAQMYGETFAKLAHSLAKDKAKRESTDVIKAIVAKASKLPDADLQELIKQLQGVFDGKTALLAEAGGIDTGETEQEAPVTEPEMVRELEAA